MDHPDAWDSLRGVDRENLEDKTPQKPPELRKIPLHCRQHPVGKWREASSLQPIVWRKLAWHRNAPAQGWGVCHDWDVQEKLAPLES